MRELHDIATGAEAWAIFLDPIGKRGTRWTLVGVGRVRVLESHVDGIHNAYRVEVLSASGVSPPLVGRERAITRGNLYPRGVRSEHLAFRADLGRIYGEPLVAA